MTGTASSAPTKSTSADPDLTNTQSDRCCAALSSSTNGQLAIRTVRHHRHRERPTDDARQRRSPTCRVVRHLLTADQSDRCGAGLSSS
ncbi:MAG TPA: hypothetical protein VNP92_15465, partial [Actinophytocola sp.]|nr:hypothetical protein [Actinophytocola sp.]